MGIRPGEADGCPSCGSRHLVKTGEVDARTDNVSLINTDKSGYFECQRCGDEHYYESDVTDSSDPLTKIQFFMPTAKCPDCGSFNTLVVYTQPKRRLRNHECRDCPKKFQTRH